MSGTTDKMSAAESGACPASLAPAVSNYFLLVYGPGAADPPRAALFFVDTGGGSYDETLGDGVVAWLAAAQAQIEAEYGPLPSVAFAHIPAPEFAGAYPGRPGAPCVGILADDGVTPTVGHNGLVPALRAANRTRALVSGHDHGNTYCCSLAQPGSLTRRSARAAAVASGVASGAEDRDRACQSRCCPTA